MKLMLIATFLTFSNISWAANLTHKLQATLIKYNDEHKNYDVSFSIRSGIYHADEKQLKCLENSIEKKREVYIEYEAMGLKIIKCY